MKFHLAHVVPNKMAHGLNGYKEVIDTVQWGLRELGHSAEYGLNKLSPTVTNIGFGAQIMTPELLETLSTDTIVYHFEQIKGQEIERLRPQARLIAERFRIWEYNSSNASVWAQLGAKDVRTVPIGYAPILQRIKAAANQDIDVLLYGSTSPDRLSAFHYLSQAGLTTAFVCGLYGAARDELIGRSKLIVNINQFDRSKIFEIVRVSYLLANRKAVVADVDPDTDVDPDIRSAIKVSRSRELVQDCVSLAADDAARRALEESGFAVMQKRDIRPILQQALAASPKVHL